MTTPHDAERLAKEAVKIATQAKITQSLCLSDMATLVDGVLDLNEENESLKLEIARRQGLVWKALGECDHYCILRGNSAVFCFKHSSLTRTEESLKRAKVVVEAARYFVTVFTPFLDSELKLSDAIKDFDAAEKQGK